MVSKNLDSGRDRGATMRECVTACISDTDELCGSLDAVMQRDEIDSKLAVALMMKKVELQTLRIGLVLLLEEHGEPVS